MYFTTLTITGSKLMMTMTTRQMLIQTALSTFSPVCQWMTVLPPRYLSS